MRGIRIRQSRKPVPRKRQHRRGYRRKRAARRVAVSAKDQAAELIKRIEREYLARELGQRSVLLIVAERKDHPDQLRLLQKNRAAFRRDRSVENDVERE